MYSIIQFPRFIDKVRKNTNNIDPDKEIVLAYNCNYYLTHQFKTCVMGAQKTSRSFEYPKHMFWLRNEKNIFFQYTLLSGGLNNLNTAQFLYNS